MTQSSPLLMIELNELNFEFVQAYIENGKLPHFAALLAEVGYAETTSEASYGELEPWIQWVTAHTGKPLKGHGVFRLGDIVNHDIPQIWEKLAEKGLTVGAISPMNAKCRSRDLAFFVPDPWTKTDIIARPVVRRMFEGIVQAVADNSEKRITTKSAFNLLFGAAATAQVKNYFSYLRYALDTRKSPWKKAIFLDTLLSDLFVREIKRNCPQFATLFLNAGAHIQHHYLFSSKVYNGDRQNPGWYIQRSQDPILDVYTAYDNIIGGLRKAFPKSRLMIATGLHQDAHHELTYYWRLRDHATFLSNVGAVAFDVTPLMSRDFVVNCGEAANASRTQTILEGIVDGAGLPLFEVDNRGCDLFVTLSYPHEITTETVYQSGNQHYHDLKANVAFVAIKNGQHNGIGYFSDSGHRQSPANDRFPLMELSDRVEQALMIA